MVKRIVMFGLLVVALASAKTYSFTIFDRAQAGTAQLKPGEYRLKLDGAQVALIDMDGRQIDVVATVEQSDVKFDQTSITATDADGIHRILSIQLHGTNNKVVFSEAGQP